MAIDRVRWWDPKPNTYSAATDAHPTEKRIRYGLLGLQRVLRGAECDCALTGEYDEYTRRAVAYFQGSKSGGLLHETGVFDERTARELFSRLCNYFEVAYALPYPLMKGYCAHEGVWDMCSLGPNLKDTGIVMINLGDDAYGAINPHTGLPYVSMRQACNPLYAIPFAVNRWVEAMEVFDNVDAATVYHRSPLWADCMAGVQTWEAAWDKTEGKKAPEDRTWATANDMKNAAELYVENIKSGG
jgi:hypothetical protein